MTRQSLTRGNPFARQESGFGVVEVVIAAAIMLTVAMGTLALLDGAGRTSHKNRARAVSADLAEQDQERMRGLGVATLSYYSLNRTVTVGGIPYKVASDSDWLRDSTGAPVTCTNASGQAEYMRITSTVTEGRAGASGLKPVTMTSIVAPPVGSIGPTQGTLAVEVKNRDNGPQPAIPVAIAGPQPATEPTNDMGCAVFNYFRVGTYSVELNTMGFVNPLGVTDVVTSGAINGGTVNTTAPQQYDRAATINVSFKTKDVAGADVPVSPAKWTTVGNSGIGNATGTRTFGSATTFVNTIQANLLFPFANGYTVYSGNCTANDPSRYSATSTLQSVDPAGAYVTTVYQPALQFATTKNGVAMMNAHVTATAQDAGCAGQVYDFYTGGSSSQVLAALPFGKYKVCVDDNNPTVASRLIYRPTTVYTNSNTVKATSVTAADSNITTSSAPKGTCP
jgi:hypothetical protein